MTCQNCASKDAIILRQQKEIKRLQKKIAQAQEACAVIIGNSDRILSQNQPRGRWAYATGAKRAAVAINDYLI